MSENVAENGENPQNRSVNPQRLPRIDLVALIASGATVREAAEATGLNERTVYRRLTDETTRQAIDTIRAELISAATGRLTSYLANAADTLQSLLLSDSENVQRLTAIAIIELVIRLREHADLAEDVARLRDEVKQIREARQQLGGVA